MKFITTYFAPTLLTFLMLVFPADNKVNFSGVWKMDKAKTSGIPPNMEQEMRVRQEGDKLNLETGLIVEGDVTTVKDGISSTDRK